MTPFIVVKNTPDMGLRGVAPTTPGRLGGIAYTMFMQDEVTDMSGGDVNSKANLYSVRTAAEAMALAQYLAGRYPGTSWAVAQCLETYQTTPGPVSRAVFSDQGLMPAV